MPVKAIFCPYCARPAVLTTGAALWPQRHTEVATRAFWACRPCGAFVACHPGTSSPVGRLANQELHQAHNVARVAFEPLYTTGFMRRPDAERWLAGKLGLPRRGAHIPLLDLPQARKAAAVAREYRNDLARVRRPGVAYG